METQGKKKKGFHNRGIPFPVNTSNTEKIILCDYLLI